MRICETYIWVVIFVFVFQPSGVADSVAASKSKSRKRSEKMPSLEEQIKEAEAKAAKLRQLTDDLDSGKYPDLAPVLTGQWIDATCLTERLTFQQMMGGDDNAIASVYDRCEKRMRAEQGLNESGEMTQHQLGGTPAPPQPPDWCQMPTITFESTQVDNNNPSPPTGTPKLRDKQTQVFVNSSGNEITTRETVYLEYIDRLRYDASLAGNVTSIAATPIPGALTGGAGMWNTVNPFATTSTPKAPATGAKAFSAKVVTPGDTEEFDKLFQNYQTCFSQMQTKMRAFQATLNTVEAAQNGTQEDITTRLNNLLPVVATPGEVRAAADMKIFPTTEAHPWPGDAIIQMAKLASEFKSKYTDLKTDKNYVAWTKLDPKNQAAYDQLALKADEFGKLVDQYAPNGNEATKYETSRKFIKQWRDRFKTVAGANDDYFIVEVKPACGGWFGAGTRTQLQLTTHDRLNPTAADKIQNLDIVVCQPAITVSTGLGFSFIADRTPAFVPIVKVGADGKPVLDSNGNETIAQSLGYSSESKVRPAYSLQANVAIAEGKTNGVGLHWGLGTSITDTSGGAALDLFTGPAFSFKRRAIFISPVFDFGRRTDYMSQFHVGQLQGNLTSPPTESKWRFGFGLTITFPFSSGTTTTTSTKESNSEPAVGSPTATGEKGKLQP